MEVETSVRKSNDFYHEVTQTKGVHAGPLVANGVESRSRSFMRWPCADCIKNLRQSNMVKSVKKRSPKLGRKCMKMLAFTQRKIH